MEKIDITQIPEGDYCYTLLAIVRNGRGMKIKTCPYWELMLDKPEQDNGYCHYLKYGDWEHNGLGLLWDQVKECGVNIDY